jgi:hypothetical protein
VPAGAMLPGAGYDEHAGCPDAPSGPNATSTATAMRASATAPAAIEVARLVAGTRSESGTGTIGAARLDSGIAGANATRSRVPESSTAVIDAMSIQAGA